jgi:hypothetical protein
MDWTLEMSLVAAAGWGGLAGGAMLIIAHAATESIGPVPILWRYAIGVTGIGLGLAVGATIVGWQVAVPLVALPLPVGIVVGACGLSVKIAHLWHPLSARLRLAAASPVDTTLEEIL